MKPIGIIGGSGHYELLESPRMFVHDNKYGRSSEIYEGVLNGSKVYFLPRHGPNHHIIVPRINYRANIWALKELGVEQIIATNSVGSLNPAIQVGELVIPHDFINFTSRTPRSLYDDTTRAYHVEMSPPYCPEIRARLISSAKKIFDGPVHDEAVIIIIEGLSFSTPHEQKLFRQWGADLVGMTNAPEAILAREAELCYAHICMPTDCAGKPIKADTFPTLLRKGVQAFNEILYDVVGNLPETRTCSCGHALDHALLEKKL